MISHSFTKENGKWYIDLPEWTGPKSALQMVWGADTMLDRLAKDDNHIELQLSLTEIPDSIHLKRNLRMFGGYSYKCTMDNTSTIIWLCGVTKFVFGEFPRHLYISKDIKSYK